jgi:hypothetical protein
MLLAISFAAPASADWYDGSALPPSDLASASGIPTINWMPKSGGVAMHHDGGWRLRASSATGIAAFIRDPYGAPFSYNGLSGTRIMHNGAGPWNQDNIVLIDLGAVSPKYVVFAAHHGANLYNEAVAPFAFDTSFIGNAGACAGVLQGGAGNPDHDDCVREGGPSGAAYAYWYALIPDWSGGSGDVPRWRVMDDGGWHVFSPDNTGGGIFVNGLGLNVQPSTLPGHDYVHWARGIVMQQSTNHTWFGDPGPAAPPAGTANPAPNATGLCDPVATSDTNGTQPFMRVRTTASPGGMSYALPQPTLNPAPGYSVSWGSLTATVPAGPVGLYGASATTTGTTLNYTPQLWRRMTTAIGPGGLDYRMTAQDPVTVQWTGVIDVTDGVTTTSTPWGPFNQTVNVAVCPRLPTPDPNQTMTVPGIATTHDILNQTWDDEVWDDNSLDVTLGSQLSSGLRIGRYESPDGPAPGAGTEKGPLAAERPLGINTTGRFRFLPGRSIVTGTRTIGFSISNDDGKVFDGGTVRVDVTNAAESPT